MPNSLKVTVLILKFFAIGFLASSVKTNREEELLIIDTDCGVDDAIGLMFALFHQMRTKFCILGITCVGGGNTAIENVCSNVLRILQLTNRDDIPVYSGCPKALLNENSALIAWGFGDDGFGGMAHKVPVGNNNISTQNAVNFMYDSVTMYPGKVNLLLLGPMTNAAVAQILFADFSSKLKSVQAFAGSLNGMGGISPMAEFNVFSDPEAAKIVFNKFECPIIVVTRDVYKAHRIPWAWTKDKILNSSSSMGRFIRYIYGSANWLGFRKTGGFTCADLYTVAVFMVPELALERKVFPVDIELAGSLSRGAMVADQRDFINKTETIEFVTKIDIDRLKLLMNNMIENFVLNY